MRVHSSQRGFTFIELVMFIVIVGVAVTAITLLFVQNVRYSADPLIRQKSLAVAKAYMDEIVRKKWDELTPDGGGCIDTATLVCEGVWQANTVYNPGDRVRATPFNNHIYEVVGVSGSQKSGAAEPTWPTGGGTVSDANVTWQDMGAPTIGADGGELRSQYDDVDDYHNPAGEAPQYPDPGDLVDGESPMPGYDGFNVYVSVSNAAWEGMGSNDVKKIDLQVDAPNGESLTFTLYRLNY